MTECNRLLQLSPAAGVVPDRPQSHPPGPNPPPSPNLSLSNFPVPPSSAGVGFSYTTDDKELNIGDQQTADDNYLTVQKFFDKFPNLRGNDFYLTSESYGGQSETRGWGLGVRGWGWG